MGTKITVLPPVITPTGADELPISQATGLTGRTTYKATLDQIKSYIGAGQSGSVTSVGVNSTDGSIAVFGSPITSSGTISLTISSVGLDKLDDGGATGGEVLTYNGSTSAWEPGYGGSSGIIPNILVGNGGTTYTLINYTNDTASNYLVFVGGVAQRPTTDFTISGSSIIFGSSIPSGAQILVYAVINIATLNVDATPIGTVTWFAASAAPTSYLECSGGVVAISDYLDLWYVIGTKFNTGGEGAGNFRVPDLRGEFIRGWDNGRGVDTGRNFGSNQSDEFRSHTHRQQTQGSGSLNQSPVGGGSLGNTGSETFTQSTGGTETRPRNVALLPCIKAQKTVTGDVSTLNFIEKPASPTNGQVLTYNGSTNRWEGKSSISLNNTITLNNQPIFNFNNIPNWATKITLLFDNVNNAATTMPLIRLGSNGTIETSGYLCTSTAVANNDRTAAGNSTIGFNMVYGSPAVSDTYTGSVIFNLMLPNTWICTGTLLNSGESPGATYTIAGKKTLSGVLDTIQITNQNGSVPFSTGSISIIWQ